MCDFLKLLIIPCATLTSAAIGCGAVWWTARSLDRRAFREKVAAVLAEIEVGDGLVVDQKMDILLPVAHAVFAIAPTLRDEQRLLKSFSDYAEFCKKLNPSGSLAGTYVNMIRDSSTRKEARALLEDIIHSI